MRTLHTLSLVTSILLLGLWHTASQGDEPALSVESGKVRGEETAPDVSSPERSSNTHRRRSKTHGANSTWCGATDCGEKSSSGTEGGAVEEPDQTTNPDSTDEGAVEESNQTTNPDGTDDRQFRHCRNSTKSGHRYNSRKC